MLNLKFIALSLLAVLCHELSHALCAFSLGVKVKRVGISWLGPYIVRETGSDIQNLAISLAGPLTNLLLSGSLVLCPWLGVEAIWFALINFSLGFYNLMPVPHSDGQRIVRLLAGAKPELVPSASAARSTASFPADEA